MQKMQKVCVRTCFLSEPPSMIDLLLPPRHYQTGLSPSECRCSSIRCSTLQLSACKTSPYNGAKPVAKHSDDCAILRRQYRIYKVQQHSHSCLKFSVSKPLLASSVNQDCTMTVCMTWGVSAVCIAMYAACLAKLGHRT